MSVLPLHEFHQRLGANFDSLNGAEVVADYGDVLAEHAALRDSAGVLDLSFRGRLCLTGADRLRFLHGQVTNDVKKLRVGEGCYAALTTAKGKMQSDLNAFVLPDELLLDCEPGYATTVTQRLEKYIVADDVQVVDVSPLYGLLSIQGPKSKGLHAFCDWPDRPFGSVKFSDATLGEIYVINNARLGSAGFDLFVPAHSMEGVADIFISASSAVGGRAVGWSAFEMARIEAGIPRYGVDMDETNFPMECGIETRAVSYTKGCYIGQEVLNRIHSMGHVNRELRGLRLSPDLKTLPVKGDKLFEGDREVGCVTSATGSSIHHRNLALGYVRREAAAAGTKLTIASAAGKFEAVVTDLPLVV